MKDRRFYNAIINNGIGVNLRSFDRESLIEDICAEFNSKGFECLKLYKKGGSGFNGIQVMKEEKKVVDILFDKYGVCFSKEFSSSVEEPIKILSLYLAEVTFN